MSNSVGNLSEAILDNVLAIRPTHPTIPESCTVFIVALVSLSIGILSMMSTIPPLPTNVLSILLVFFFTPSVSISALLNLVARPTNALIAPASKRAAPENTRATPEAIKTYGEATASKVNKPSIIPSVAVI